MRSVEDSIRRGTVRLRAENQSRNAAQSVTLLEAIAEFGFDAAIGGARRDEEKARAKERVFSFRDEFGQWDPRNQRPELWSLYNARVQPGRARARVPDQQLDRARRLAVHRAREARSALDLLRAPAPGGAPPRPDRARDPAHARPRRRSGRGDLGALPHRGRHQLHLPGRIGRPPTIEKIIAETVVAKLTERGATRMDDQTSDASMERRKKEGYF